MNLIIPILLLLLFVCCNCQDRRLDQVIEIARHGARSPLFDYYDAKDWNMLRYQVTQIGMRQHYLIGRQLRKKYIINQSFLSPTFNSSEIYVYCSSAARTIMSAQSQMLGLYYESGEDVNNNWRFQAKTDLPPLDIDPEEGQTIIENLKGKNLPFSYQPIPQFSFPNPNQDVILETFQSCSKIGELAEENKKSQTYLDFVQVLEANNIFERFRQAFKLSNDTELDIVVVSRYFDTIICDVYQQRELPEDFDEELYDWVKFMYDFRMLYEDFGSDLNFKLQATHLFRDMIEQIQKQGESKKKFLYYSSSDSSLDLLNLIMNVIQVPSEFSDWKQNQKRRENAQFASTIFLEIYIDEQNQRTVRYIFNGEVQTEFGDCMEEYCDLDIFINNLQQWILSDDEYNSFCEDSNIQIAGIEYIKEIFNFVDWN